MMQQLLSLIHSNAASVGNYVVYASNSPGLVRPRGRGKTMQAGLDSVCGTAIKINAGNNYAL